MVLSQAYGLIYIYLISCLDVVLIHIYIYIYLYAVSERQVNVILNYVKTAIPVSWKLTGLIV